MKRNNLLEVIRKQKEPKIEIVAPEPTPPPKPLAPLGVQNPALNENIPVENRKRPTVASPAESIAQARAEVEAYNRGLPNQNLNQKRRR